MAISWIAAWLYWRTRDQVDDSDSDSDTDDSDGDGHGDTDGHRERGDVPGWVLITLMTAGIVTALWVVAEPTLRNLLTNALNITGDPNK
jgi:hypothetical protein